MNEIVSVSNPIIKLFRALHEKKYRQKHRLFLIEGHKLLNEAINSGIKIDTVLYLKEYLNEVNEKFFTVFKNYYQINERLMEKVSTLETPPQVIASAEFIEYQNNNKKNNLQLFCDRLQDPGNFGTLIRLSEAIGVDKIWIPTNTVDKYNPKVVRASAGSLFRVPVYETRDIKECILNLKEQNFKVLGAFPQADTSLYSLDLTGAILIVIGQEGSGISSELVDLIDIKFKIPMYGQVESLNVATSTAIILGEVLRQRIK